MLSEAGYQVGLIGSLGIYDGETMYPTYETTPPPNELAYWLFRMVANGCTHVLIEISSVAIAQSRLAGLKLDAVCMTNIRRDHLDYHQTVENYRRTKLRVFKYARKKGIVVCNNDDRITNAVLPLIDHPVLTTGIQRQAEVNGSVIEQTPYDQTFLITAGTETVAMCSRVIGNEHVYNCLTAAALGIGWGLDLKTVVRGLERVENIPSRLERITCGQPFSVFIDCGQTPETLTSTLQTLRSVTDGRLICVFGASSNQEAGKRKLIGRAIDTLTDLSVITTDSIFDNEAIVAMNEIVDAFNGEVAPLTFDDRIDAIAWALSEARESDCVLIVGKGQVETIPDESSVPTFCDRLFVKQWLYENNPLAEENWVA
jgi:UDP-N-acetylmuramoyl-L-alanyl-D-glutamate--2,6-diaminopimelate ligase